MNEITSNMIWDSKPITNQFIINQATTKLIKINEGKYDPIDFDSLICQNEIIFLPTFFTLNEIKINNIWTNLWPATLLLSYWETMSDIEMVEFNSHQPQTKNQSRFIHDLYHGSIWNVYKNYR